ncbi:MAG: Asp-tRNA(Asn)/Glu-tRNA(Gln) amidotransferase subunit GatC [Candidatus Bathyarchaeia archaeon]
MKNQITREEVEHIAWLAHIELTEEEKKIFTEQFNKILDFFKKINEVDTEHVPPTYHVLDISNVERQDEVGESLPQTETLKNAPKKEDGFFKSPRIV